MSVSPHEIWEHALSLPSSTESEKRAKISRAYYALYSHALAFHNNLPSAGNELRGDVGLHKRLNQKLTNPTVADEAAKSLSRQLGTKQGLAHEIRVKADYKLDEHVSDSDVTKCLSYVRKGLELGGTA